MPGILQWPNDARNWRGRACTWTNLNRPDIEQDSLEYFCTAITRAFHQGRRVRRLANLLKEYAGWSVSIAGHSNGCDIIVRALSKLRREHHRITLETVHLACGACHADFQANGLNMGLLTKQIGKVYVYVAGRDKALALAGSWLGRILGYGTLGLHGPLEVQEAVKERVGTMQWPEYGHSTCFHPKHFDATMGHFTQ